MVVEVISIIILPSEVTIWVLKLEKLIPIALPVGRDSNDRPCDVRADTSVKSDSGEECSFKRFF